MVTFAVGHDVIYQSTRGFIPAKIIAGPHQDGTFDLDCKPRVSVARMQACSAPTPSMSSNAVPVVKPTSAACAPSPGDRCFYKSSSHGWIPAKFLQLRPEYGTYDLDVKQSVAPSCIHWLREGCLIEYFSATRNVWISARIVKQGCEADTFDLDCKPCVELSRMRPPQGPVPGEGPSDAASQLSRAVPPPGAATQQSNKLSCSSGPCDVGKSTLPEATNPGLEQESAWQGPSSPSEARPLATRTSTGQFQVDAPKGKSSVGASSLLPPASTALASSVLPLASSARASSDHQNESTVQFYDLQTGPEQQQAAAVDTLRVASVGQDILALQAAMRDAEVHGVDRTELKRASIALQALELRQAAAGRDPHHLRQAIRAATEIGVSREHLEEARRALQAMDSQTVNENTARAAISDAERSGNVQALRAALEGAAGKLPHAELEALRGSLQALEAREAWRGAARHELRSAMEQQDMYALRSALQSGEKAGLSQDEMHAPQRALDRLETQASAEKNIQQAAANGEPLELQRALQDAKTSGMSQGRIDTIYSELRCRALSHLRQAVHSQNACALRKAVEMAGILGVTGEELDQAGRVLWALEARPKALAELHNAKKMKKQDALLAAIEAATAAGVAPKELDAADRILREVQAASAKHEARQRVQQAFAKQDAETLQRAIQSATAAGLPEQEFASVVIALKDLKAKGPAREELKRAEEVGTPAALRAAIQYAQAAGLAPDELKHANTRLAAAETQPATRPQLHPDVKVNDAASNRGLKTCLFGPGPTQDAGLVTRMFGPAETQDAGLMTRVFGPAPSQDAGVMARIFGEAAAGSPTGRQQNGGLPSTQPQLHIPAQPSRQASGAAPPPYTYSIPGYRPPETRLPSSYAQPQTQPQTRPQLHTPADANSSIPSTQPQLHHPMR